jgi:ABC-type dipeptide/oligopeptide/nickel transport system permease subunit
VTISDSPAATDAAAATVVPQVDAGIADVQPGRAMWRDVWRRFRRNKLAMAGLIFVILLILVAIFASVIAPFGYAEYQNPRQIRKPPSMEHWLGTDDTGYDVFSRIVYGARISLRIGILATILSLLIGVTLGAFAGFYGGFSDTALMRLTDMFLAIPYIILAIAIATVLGKSETSIILVLGLTGWLAITRIVRATFLSLKELEYVEAARALGYSHARIMFRHILPNAAQPIIVYGTIAIGSVILAEAALSFLGVGPTRPTQAWGLMVAEGRDNLANAPHTLLFPGLAILLTVLAFVFIGDGLRDALDPKLRGRS